MKLMTTHGSATVREETPHATETTIITISDAVRRQAQSIVDDTSIDPEWRAVIRHYLETNDPWVAELLPRAEAGETVIDTIDFPQISEADNDESSVEKVKALSEIICQSGGEATAALFVLMGTLQNSPRPEMLANAARHYAFTRCGELNIFGMVDAQSAVVEGELLSSNTVVT
jgi:hypothetical protein